MINTHGPTINLDLDLLRTFVAVADVKTFAAAAIVVQRTQSVSYTHLDVYKRQELSCSAYLYSAQ